MYHIISYVTMFAGIFLILLFLILNLINLIRKHSGKTSFFAKDISNRTFVIFFCLILTCAAFLRLYRLCELPAGMHVDEAGMAYDAYCLANYGVERFCNRFPVYLINYDSGQSALYAYLAAFFIKILGNSLLAVRLPAFSSGMYVVLFGGLIFKELFSKRTALFGASLLAVCPYFMMASRFGFDCNLFLGCSVVLIWLLLMAIRYQKHTLFLLAGLMCGITLYSYSLSWLAIPMFLLLTLIYLLCFKKLCLKDFLFFTIPSVILAVPLLLLLYVNMTGGEAIVTPFFTIPVIPTFRSDGFSVANILPNLRTLFVMLLSQDQYIFNSFDDYYTLYRLSIPFIIVGFVLILIRLIRSLIKRQFSSLNVAFFFLLSMTVLGLIITNPDIYRMNGIFFSMILLVVLCVHDLCSFMKHPAIPFGSVLALYVFNAVFFIHFYFTQYQDTYTMQWFFNDYCEDIFEELKEEQPDCHIYVDNFNCSLYAYDMWIREISPYDFSKENHPDMDGEECYLNTTYSLPDPAEIQENCIYIVFEQNGFRDYLDGLSFTGTKHGYYFVYRHD